MQHLLNLKVKTVKRRDDDGSAAPEKREEAVEP